MARPCCSAVERAVADLVDLAVGHVDVAYAVDDDAEVLRAVDVSVGDAGRVVDTDVAAGRVELAGDGPADLCGGEVHAVADEPGRVQDAAAKVAAGRDCHGHRGDEGRCRGQAGQSALGDE